MMNDSIRCPQCGAALLYGGGAPVRIACPVCGAVFSPGSIHDDDVIDVQVTPVGESPREEAAPFSEKQVMSYREAGSEEDENAEAEAPRVDVRYWQVGGETSSGGGGCFGTGCLLIVVSALFLMIRGCMSLF